MRRMSPDYSGNAYEHTRSLAYDYNYDPSNRDSPDKVAKLDPYSDDYSNPSKSPPRRSRSPDVFGAASTSTKRPDRSTRNAGKATQRLTTPPISASPTPEYLLTSLQPSSKLTSPSDSRKLLILDLNGTLVFRSPHRRDYYKRIHLMPNFTQRPLRTVFPRPYFPSFRDYLFHPTTRTWLDTMVWSSAQPHSVADMVDKCFGDRKEELVAVWARDTLGLAEQDYNRKAQTTKDLAKPWSALPLDPTTSDSPQKHSAETTILLDDSPRKAHLQPYNHLCVREYSADTRGNDVAVRDAEVLASRAEQSSSSSTLKEIEGETLEATKKRKRKARKREKMQKQRDERKWWKAKEQARVRGDCEYDEMLLAVVGVLEELKVQGNVAGWMRSGGLLLGEEGEAESSAKKQRLSDETEFSDSPGSPPPSSSSQRLLEEDSSTVPVDDGSTNIPTSTFTGIPMDNANPDESPLWFHDTETVEWWADRGRVALDELGIEVVSGVIGTYDS